VRASIIDKEKFNMNKNLNEAIVDIGKVDSMLYAIEKTYLEVGCESAGKEMETRRVYAFYALWDAVRKVADDLERLAEDRSVVDVIQAVDEVRRNRDASTM
jgi:hypothetical protein